MTTLRDWFENPVSTLTTVAAYNPPTLSSGLLGFEQPDGPTPPPLQLWDLTSFKTPFCVLWNRPNNVLQK